MSRAPSAKDATAFKSAMNMYEARNYKNALVETDKILKRSPKYGDALCLKALIVYHLDRKDECLQLVLDGTKESPESSVVWHMAGIYYKLVKNYPDAYKAFLKSFRLNSDNISVHHDLSMLAVQQRQIGPLNEVRRAMLSGGISIHMVWINMAVAQYLAFDFASAIKTLELFDKLLDTEKKSPRGKKGPNADLAVEIERSEMLLFKNLCIEKTGNIQAALDDLVKHEAHIRDKLSYQEKRAEYFVKLGRTADATQAYRDLIKRNPNNASYYESLEAILEISDSVSQRTALYRSLAKKYPRAEVPQLLPLSFLQGNELHTHLKNYIESKLKRGVPSCFAFVKDVYRENYDIASKVGDEIAAQAAPEDPEAQTVWAIFVARHLSYTGRHAEALTVIESAKLPDMAEVLLAQAKILSRQGDFTTAAEILEKAATREPGDRFLNAKAAKYALKNNDVAKSVEIASIFPIAGMHTLDGIKHLTELESVNYLAPLASAYSRVADHGMALKRAEGVASVFETYWKDQYDFHYYGPRRGNTRAYLDLLQWEDSLYCHPRYLEAVEVAAREYIALATGEDDGVDEETKAKLKTKRAKLIKKWESEPPFTPKGYDKPEERDSDPFGREFLDKKAPLDEALRLWQPLQQARPTDIRTWKIAFDIYLAQKKYVLAIQSLKKAKELGAASSYLAYAGAKARFQLELDESAPEVIRNLQLKMLPSIAPEEVVSMDLVDFVDKFVREDFLLWADARHFLGNTDGIAAVFAKEAVADIDVCTKASLLLSKWHLDATEFNKAVKAKWPRASFLK